MAIKIAENAIKSTSCRAMERLLAKSARIALDQLIVDAEINEQKVIEETQNMGWNY